MRYSIQSVTLGRRSGADTYRLALIQPCDRGRAPVLLRWWGTKGYEPKSILQMGWNQEKANELRGTFPSILSNQLDKGYELEDIFDHDGTTLVQALAPDAMRKNAWWFQLVEPGQNEKLLNYFRQNEAIDPEETAGDAETIARMLDTAGSGKSTVSMAPMTGHVHAGGYVPGDVRPHEYRTVPVNLGVPKPAPPKPAAAESEMPGWGEWA